LSVLPEPERSDRLAQPERIGRYVVQAMLGRGAMGVIYKAHDPVIDRTIAIKLVHADLLDGEDRTEYVARFRAEAQAAGRCSHPNVVAVYDFAMHGENPYLAMEFIDGVTLSQIEKDGRRFEIPEIIDLMGQMLDGLGAAHALGVVHRDIKPANVMLTAQGRVKVTDFGISRIDTSVLTGAGAILGTPSYMSPEQCRGETVDARGDLFSAGVVLYELVTGKKPFTGPSQHEIWRKLLDEAPPDPAPLRPDAPPFLLEVIRRSLAKQPSDRFASAPEMAAALRGGAPVAPGLELDRTVIATQASQGGGLDLDSSQMGTIERHLARIVGPIASVMIRRAARTADSVETLCRTLESGIEQDDRRAQFRKEVVGIMDQTGSRSGLTTEKRTTLSEAELEQAQRALTRYMGPVARVLVKRNAPGCVDARQLWQRLAEQIEQKGDRAEFLRQQPAA
jgi:serine/threonine protein kinase